MLRTLVLAAFMIACSEKSQLASDDSAHATPPTVNAMDPEPAETAIQRLHTSDATVEWEAESAVVGDFDCDGSTDSAFVGRSASRIEVGIVRANAPTELLSFGTNGSAIQEDVGSAKAQLTLESLDYDPTEAVGTIDGFQRSKTCKGLNLGDGESDSMHIFWNRKTGHLDWWRA